MATAELSRAVSSLDLNAALSATQTQTPSTRYTKEELLSLRPESDDEKHAEHSEIPEIGPNPDGIMTPPSQTCPAPPPPTPEDEKHAQATLASYMGKVQLPKTSDSSLRVATEAEPKKKKKKKSSGKNRKPPVTGFEEFYADPPLTPDEHDEECDLYSQARPLHERIETCIQRYRGKRNLDSIRSNILTKYFMLGGIEASAKMFTGGLDRETVENSTAEEIRTIRATDYVRSGSKKYFDPSHPENWVVDFEGVSKGFFSYRIPRLFNTKNEEDIKLYCAVVRNFLNYVLSHAVCPEYTMDIMAARKICDMAEKELCALKDLQYLLPGQFNMAASTLYGGRYEGIHISTQPWAKEDPNFEDYIKVEPGLGVPEAERIFKTAIAFAGNDELFVAAMRPNVEIIKTETKRYEIVGIERPGLPMIEEYAQVKNHRGEAGYIKALGVVKFKAWEGPNLDEEDFTDDEGDIDRAAPVNDIEKEHVETFWLEDEALQLCFMGMKLEVIVHELNIGIKFFDTIVGMYCSFHTVLPNEKMAFWKEPTLSTRPPPTEDDPEAEERAINATIDAELDEDEKLLNSK